MTITLENATAVALYNKEGEAFEYAPIEKRSKNTIVVKGTNFSAKTGKILSKQSSNCFVLWPTVEDEYNLNTSPNKAYKDICTHIEPFDTEQMEFVQVNREEVHISPNNDTLESYFERVKEEIKNRDIPSDAVIHELYDDSFYISYQRRETFNEYTVRAYRNPKKDELRKISELNKCNEAVRQTEAELERLRKLHNELKKTS